MRNHLFVFLVVLIFSTSLSQEQKLKTNDRRASGLVPYPRIGRNSESAGFPRSDRAAGMVHYPRVGRSDLPISGINFNHYHDMEPDAEFQFYNMHDVDLDTPLDEDYEGFSGKSLKHADKILKDIAWLIPDRVHSLKEYRPAQKIDESRPFYANVRGLRNSQLSLNGYTPRLGRETDHDALASFL